MVIDPPEKFERLLGLAENLRPIKDGRKHQQANKGYFPSKSQTWEMNSGDWTSERKMPFSAWAG
jgi:hypothetical protein